MMYLCEFINDDDNGEWHEPIVGEDLVKLQARAQEIVNESVEEASGGTPDTIRWSPAKTHNLKPGDLVLSADHTEEWNLLIQVQVVEVVI